jgi:hypothetical protein
VRAQELLREQLACVQTAQGGAGAGGADAAAAAAAGTAGAGEAGAGAGAAAPAAQEEHAAGRVRDAYERWRQALQARE